jgi:hypothetical protein
MLIAIGTALVLLTWAVVAAGVMVIGLPLAALTHTGPISVRDARRALWWGLPVFACIAMLMANVVPLGSPPAGAMVIGIVAVGLIASWALIRRRGWVGSCRMNGGTAAVAVLSGAVIAYLALAALGPVTNFDSGLYHLSAIGLAQEFVAIPGLANLHAPLGYANASFPMAAVLGATPWGPESYRLLNGLIITLVLIDLVIRWLDRRVGAGSYGLLAGAVVLVIPMVALSDYWVTSPSQDAAVFAVTVAVSALVMQSVADPRQRIPEIAAAAAGSIALVLLRPTMITFALAVVAVAIVLMLRSRATARGWLRAAGLVGALGLLGALAQTLRDYTLSGWLVYPLSLLPFDVPWRATDPVYLRTATLGYHRDADDLWQAAAGWDWVGPWLSRLPQQWEFWLLVLLVAGCVGALLVALRWGATLRTRAMLVAMAPSAVMVAVWWVVTPPSFRFAWGPVFTLATVPLGWMVWRSVLGRSARQRRVWATSIAWLAVVPVAMVVGFSLVARLEWDSMTSSREWRAGVTIPYAVSPALVPMTNAVELEDGLRVQVPVDGSACWAAPLPCTSELDGRIRLIDASQGLPGGLAVSPAE